MINVFLKKIGYLVWRMITFFWVKTVQAEEREDKLLDGNLHMNTIECLKGMKNIRIIIFLIL